MKSIIVNSELDFRKNIILNKNNIYKIIIFEDELDNCIYFYCFLHDKTYIATKEYLINNYSFYIDLYKHLIEIYELNIIFEFNKQLILKLNTK